MRDINMDVWDMRWKIEKAEEWRDWVRKIPSINFPSDWSVRIIPAFAGAMIRFLVTKGDKEVSVYLDVFARLGAWDEPYWEIYPYDNDTFRCRMEDVDTLLSKIGEVLEGKDKSE